MQLSNLIKNLKLDQKAREELDRVLALPEVEAILYREEHKIIANRRELLKRMSAVPDQHKKLIALAERRYVDSTDLVERLERELIEARASHQFAGMLNDGAKRAMEIEVANLVTELHEGRDRRLDNLYEALDKLDDQARSLTQVWPENRKSTSGGLEVVYRSNIADMTAARDALAASKSKLESLALSVLSRSEITEAMAEICANLDKPLDSLDLVAPAIDESGAVTQPRIKTGVDLTAKRIEKAAA